LAAVVAAAVGVAAFLVVCWLACWLYEACGDLLTSNKHQAAVTSEYSHTIAC
jgi:low affinity Fe/Cu permease